MCFVDRLKQASAVQTEVFRFRTLSPLLMHGWHGQREAFRDGRQSPLEAAARISSIRGVLRYWWRTLQPVASYRELLKDEQKWFGGVGGNDKGGRSPVSFRLEEPIYSQKEARVTPHNPEKKFRSKAILPGQTIHLVMSHIQQDVKLQKGHRLYVQYMLLLAGFGQRARRGAGAVQYEGFKWQSLTGMQETLRELLQQLRRDSLFAFPSSGGGLLLQRQSVEVPPHPFLNAVWAGRPYADTEEARRTISEAGKLANPPVRTGRQYLGSADPRVSSPLHATVRQVGKDYVPIITEVTSPYTADSASGRRGENGYFAAREQFLRLLGVDI